MITKKSPDLKKAWINVLAGKRIKDSKIFLTDPKFAYLYSKYIRKNRLEEDEEIIFYKDLKCAYLYCVFVKKSPPEHLHNFMISKNLENLSEEDKRWVNEYFDWHSMNFQKKAR